MSKQNENRPGYKKTKVGWIPEEWESKALGSFGSFSKGKGISNSEKTEIGLPCTTYGEIYTKHNFILKEFHSFIDAKTARTSQRIIRNDILFAGSGETLDEIGKCVAFTKDAEAYAGGDIVIFHPINVDSIFLSYALNSDFITRYKRKLGQGHSVVHIYSSGLKTLYISLPPLSEQKKIAEILSTWDRAIEQVSKLIGAKQKLKKALMHQLLTGKRRFKEFKKEKWQEFLLGDVFKERKETNRSDLPLLSITSGRGVINSNLLDKKDSSTEDKSKYKRIAPGDIGYNTMRMWQGVSALSDLEGIVSPAYTVCTPRKQLYGSFAKHLFKFKPMIHVFWRFSQGMVSDTLNLKFHNFEQIKVKIPSVSEQKKISDCIDSTNKEIELLKKKMEKLKEQKKGLMQKLLTGEVRTIISE